MAKAKKEKAPSASSADPGLKQLYFSSSYQCIVDEKLILNYLNTQNRPYSASKRIIMHETILQFLSRRF